MFLNSHPPNFWEVIFPICFGTSFFQLLQQKVSDCLFGYNFFDWVVVSNIVYIHPYLGKIPILTNIFQRGWNHQLVLFGYNFFDYFVYIPSIFVAFV